MERAVDCTEMKLRVLSNALVSSNVSPHKLICNEMQIIFFEKFFREKAAITLSYVRKSLTDLRSWENEVNSENSPLNQHKICRKEVFNRIYMVLQMMDDPPSRWISLKDPLQFCRVFKIFVLWLIFLFLLFWRNQKLNHKDLSHCDVSLMPIIIYTPPVAIPENR